MKKIHRSITSGVVATGTFLASAGQVFAADIEVPDTFFTDVGGLISSVLTFVMAIGALLVFMYLIWGGIDWITSGGDKTKTEGARNKITAAIIGLIILAAAWAILSIALNFLGAGDLNDLLREGELIK
ncbi:MAG: hypothetical protein ABFQ62_04475 [Patescibacteria group bacterium]